MSVKRIYNSKCRVIFVGFIESSDSCNWLHQLIHVINYIYSCNWSVSWIVLSDDQHPFRLHLVKLQCSRLLQRRVWDYISQNSLLLPLTNSHTTFKSWKRKIIVSTEINWVAEWMAGVNFKVICWWVPENHTSKCYIPK